jgi:hypothetical protein
MAMERARSNLLLCSEGWGGSEMTKTPEALGQFQKTEIEKWWPVIKAAGIKAQ